MKFQLKEICRIHGGIAAPKTEEAYSKEGVPFVRMKDLGQYHLTSSLIETNYYLDADYVINRNIKIIPKGSIILPRSGSVSLNHRAVLGTDAIIVSHICALEVTSREVNNLYLYYYLIVRNIDNIVKKTTGLDAVTFNDLGKLYVNIPSLEVQNYFVRSLQIIERIIKNRQQTIEILDQMVKSMFLGMFGDSQLNPKKLPQIKLASLANSFKYGTSKKSEENQDAGVPIIRIPNIQNGEVNNLDVKYTKLTVLELKSLKLKQGDLLFVRTNGNPDYIAKCAVFNEENNTDYAFASYLLRVRLKENSQILPEIICDIVNSTNFRKRIIKETRTSAGNYNINIEGLKSFSMICPDLELQKEYIKIKQVIKNVRNHLSNSLVTIESLFQSLLQNAFEGKLEFEKGKILEDILPTLKIEELLSDIKILKALLEKLHKHDFKTGSNYKLAQKLLFQLLDIENSNVNQKFDIETDNLEVKHEAN